MDGIPAGHVSEDCSLPGVPVVYLIPGLFSNTHDSHTVWPELTATGLVSATVCHPPVEFISVEAVTPRSDPGEPVWSEYTPSNTLPVPPLWYIEMLFISPSSLKVTGKARRFAASDVELYTSVLPRSVPLVDSICWVTITVLLATPAPVTVTVATLGIVPLLAELDVTVIVPLLEPEAGVMSSQSALSVIFQLVFEVMLNVPLAPDPEFKEIFDGDTFKFGVVAPGVYEQYMEYL